MDSIQERALNQAAFRRLKDSLVATYKPGRFVAISSGEVIADADSFNELRSVLAAMGKDPLMSLSCKPGSSIQNT